MQIGGRSTILPKKAAMKVAGLEIRSGEKYLRDISIKPKTKNCETSKGGKSRPAPVGDLLGGVGSS